MKFILFVVCVCGAIFFFFRQQERVSVLEKELADAREKNATLQQELNSLAAPGGKRSPAQWMWEKGSNKLAPPTPSPAAPPR